MRSRRIEEWGTAGIQEGEMRTGTRGWPEPGGGNNEGETRGRGKEKTGWRGGKKT